MANVCSLCRSALESKPLWITRDRLNLVPGEFRFYRCTQCRSAVLYPLPPKEIIQQAYPDHYMFNPDSDVGLKRFLKRIEWQLFYRRIFDQEAACLEAILRRGHQRLLDVGCGNGHRVARFREMGFRAEGLEFTSAAAANARSRLGLTVHEGTLETHAAALQGQYDVLTFFCVFEHLPDLPTTLTAARRVLKSSGWIVAKVPLAEALTVRLLGSSHLYVSEAPRHLVLPTRKGLVAALHSCGFEVVEWRPIAFTAVAGAVGLSLINAGVYARAIRTNVARYLLDRSLAVLASSVIGLPLALIERMTGPTAGTVLIARTIDR